MNIEQLKREAGALPDTERRELIGYLIARGREYPVGYWDGVATKVADVDPAHWVREQELDRTLGLDESGK